MKKRWFVIGIICSLLSILIIGCGIPQDQYDQLKSELTSSQQQVEDLTKTNGELNTRVEDLTKTRGELNTQIEDLTKTRGELEDLFDDSIKLNEELSAIVAYSIWYDYYYGTGTYSFDDVTAFNSQLGSLIAATGDTNSRAAFEVYYAIHYDYTTLVASLPEDNIWTQSQYESWRDADESLYEALGQVGGHLLIKMESIPWFGKE